MDFKKIDKDKNKVTTTITRNLADNKKEKGLCTF